MAAFVCYISLYTDLQNTYSSSVSYVRLNNGKYIFLIYFQSSNFKLYDINK